MDIGGVLTRAWAITWRYKVLWLLGFLAALGQGAGGANSGYRFGAGDLQAGRLPDIPWDTVGGLLAGFACLALLVGLILFVVSLMARGALVAGVDQAETTGQVTLAAAWSAGARRFWTLFGIAVLTALPVILVAAALVVALVALAGGTALVASQDGRGALGPLVGSLLACVCPGVCLLLVLVVVLGQVRIYAERAALLEDLGWLAAFSRGWAVLRANLGATVVLWVVFLVVGLVIGAVALAVSLPLMGPLAQFIDRGWNTANLSVALAPLCGLGLLATVVAALISAVLQTFTSATWTLAYRAMIGRA